MARPRILKLSVYRTFKNYAIAAALCIALILISPGWLFTLELYAVGIIFLISLIEPFVDDWSSRKRVNPHGKAVFITGCDTGFGHLLARRLDKLGFTVYAGCLFPNGEGAKKLKESGSSRLLVLPVDVTSEKSVRAAADYVTSELKNNKFWALVNNAGTNDGAHLMWTNFERIQKVLEVNTLGCVRVAKAFLPLIVKNEGRIVTVTSIAGRITYPGWVPYCMSKHSLISFCDGLRLELYQFGVKVVTVEPSGYKTSITDLPSITDFVRRSWEETPQEIKDLYPPDYLRRYEQKFSKIVKASTSDKLHEVIDSLHEAVTAEEPKYTYTPGKIGFKIGLQFMRKLPKPICDLMLHDDMIP